MAFGVEFGGIGGKLILTVFRILAVFAIIWYIIKQIRLEAPAGFIICVSMILAGAVGNIIDSVFYGILYRSQNLPLFQGRVIDMLYFPIVDTYLPDWFPFWKGEKFQFFRPVFNIADASISMGIISILLFQKRFFKHKHEDHINEDHQLGEINEMQTITQPVGDIQKTEDEEIETPAVDDNTAKSIEDDESYEQNATDKDKTV